MTALKLTALFFLVAAFDICFIEAYAFSDYTYVGSNYYKLHRQNASWPDAKATCQAEGAVLFHPDNVQEVTQVLRELNFGDNNGKRYFWIGSSLGKNGAYETVDGRPISQVYNTWYLGYPSSEICVAFDIDTNKIYNSNCDITGRYICKHQTTAIEEAVIASANYKIRVADLEEQVANRTAALEAVKLEMEAMKLQAANQVTALERILANRTAPLDILERQTSAMQRQAVSQPSVLERMVESIVNQTVALGLLTGAMQRQATNQSSVLERITEAIAHQAAAVERIAEIDAKQTVALEEIVEADAKQIAALERIAKTDANQNAVLERIAEGDAKQTEAMQRQGAKEIAAMERQAMALEKLASLQDSNDQLDVRSQQYDDNRRSIISNDG